MEAIFWSTDEPHADNSETMCDYLENINMLDIDSVDGTYAEGVNAMGQRFAMHADGDSFNHKIEFVELHPMAVSK